MRREHLVRYVDDHDVSTVLGRIPDEVRLRVRDVFLAGNSRAVRRLGWVTKRGRRDINLCASLPPRVSLRGYMYGGAVASDFGAPRRGQWPPWAVRRALLYDILLHELGHLQLVGEEPGTWDGTFAHEGLARAFASEWRGRLYSEAFDHPDPVHNAPTSDELDTISFWESLDKARRMQLTLIVVGESSEDPRALGYLPVTAARFLRRWFRKR